ncbi:hypothetical protein NQ315_012378 [Exocentrus adspersus]|uniref:Uncharacterized protein n=1 Tax=Exocentrus adspersus TaxID=1586481 RepID=A0AAV8VMB4_9CUCU|nr:hypothetical protein NQ315_012378 [Exocentrus adspersus]
MDPRAFNDEDGSFRRHDLLSAAFRQSAGFATDPAAQTQAKAQWPLSLSQMIGTRTPRSPTNYGGGARRKIVAQRTGGAPKIRHHYYEQTCLQPAQEPTPNQRVHVGVNPVVLLGFTVAVLSRRVHSGQTLLSCWGLPWLYLEARFEIATLGICAQANGSHSIDLHTRPPTRLKCIRCGRYVRKACSRSMKNLIVADDDKVICCEGITKSVIIELDKLGPANSADIGSDEVNKLKIQYLEEIIRQKDMIVGNQAIAITSLRDQVLLLKEQCQSSDKTQHRAWPPSD